MFKDLSLESRNIQTQNCAPIQCTVWPRYVGAIAMKWFLLLMSAICRFLKRVRIHIHLWKFSDFCGRSGTKRVWVRAFRAAFGPIFLKIKYMFFGPKLHLQKLDNHGNRSFDFCITKQTLVKKRNISDHFRPVFFFVRIFCHFLNLCSAENQKKCGFNCDL